MFSESSNFLFVSSRHSAQFCLKIWKHWQYHFLWRSNGIFCFTLATSKTIKTVRNNYHKLRDPRNSAEQTQGLAVCAHGSQVLDGYMCLYKQMMLDRQELQTNRLSLVGKRGHHLGWKWRRSVYIKTKGQGILVSDLSIPLNVLLGYLETII